MPDWGAGSYEIAAAELAPASEVVVERAGISAGDDVVDLACGTGNAALAAAQRGARVIGVDGAPRLLEVARGRAREAGVEIDVRDGDLLALPVEDSSADVALSVFGVIFAEDPGQALREIARILRPGGRALISAWIPAGPIDAMLTEMNRIVRRVSSHPAPKRTAWSNPQVVGDLAAQAGLTVGSTTSHELPIRAESPEAYIAGGQEHPMSVAMRPLVESTGIGDEMREAMSAVLREANEDPDAFLVHSPYVIHELTPSR